MFALQLCTSYLRYSSQPLSSLLVADLCSNTGTVAAELVVVAHNGRIDAQALRFRCL